MLAVTPVKFTISILNCEYTATYLAVKYGLVNWNPDMSSSDMTVAE
jgi:hypothetical protein